MKSLKHIIVLILLTSILQAMETQASVINVSTKGKENAYHFSVTLESDETGCEQYTDWWEVLSEKGDLIYRRILIHSHPDQQPFTRSGGYVKIKKDAIVYVRAHINKLGYVGDVFKGSVTNGFKKADKLPNFDEKIETQAPLPTSCLY